MTPTWMEGGRVVNTFYEKEMSAKTVIHRDSALSENSKMASLSQNMVRHMRNTSERLGMYAARLRETEEKLASTSGLRL